MTINKLNICGPYVLNTGQKKPADNLYVSVSSKNK